MRKVLTLAVASLTLASLSAVTVSSPAAAAPQPEPISVKVTHVTLGGDPRLPSGSSTVTLTNDSKVTERAAFVFGLRDQLTLGASTECEPTPYAGSGKLWKCGSWDLAPGKSVSVKVPVVAAREAAYGTTELVGWARGESLDGRTGVPQDFLVTYPAKTALRLTVTRDSQAPATARVRVTNAGAAALDGYVLQVRTPAGITATSTACLPATAGAGCEVVRGSLAAGATESFPLHFAATAGAKPVEFELTPAKRYTNADTKAVVTLG